MHFGRGICLFLYNGERRKKSGPNLKTRVPRKDSSRHRGFKPFNKWPTASSA